MEILFNRFGKIIESMFSSKTKVPYEIVNFPVVFFYEFSVESVSFYFAINFYKKLPLP